MYLPDDELISGMATSDEQALVELHRRYAPYLTGMVRKMFNDPDEVHQCVQDAFVKAWNGATSFDGSKASVKTWLVTITHRTALNKLRGTKLETIPLEVWDSPQAPPNHLTRITMQDAVGQLDLIERELIELAFYKGYSHKQIAELLDKPLGTVKSRLRKALNQLKNLLEGEGGGSHNH